MRHYVVVCEMLTGKTIGEHLGGEIYAPLWPKYQEELRLFLDEAQAVDEDLGQIAEVGRCRLKGCNPC